MDTSTPFGHISKPRAVRSRSKYRASEDEDPFQNIMHDPRVMRGLTFSQHNRDDMVSTSVSLTSELPPLPARGGGAEGVRTLRENGETEKKKLKWREKSIYDYRAPDGKEALLDLSSFLEEKEVEIAVTEIETQTDEFEPAPEDPPFIPKKTGRDASTQMTSDDQPFNFDREVRPILTIVVNKTLEQALLEVEQEAELAAIAKDLKILETEHAAEAKRVANVEAATIALHKQKEERRLKERQRLDREAIAREKVASVRLMKQVWPDILESACLELETKGTWCDPTTAAIRSEVLPWLYSEVATNIDNSRNARALADTLIKSALTQQFELQKANEKEAEKAMSTWVRIFIDGSSLGLEQDTMVGPIEVRPKDTIADLEGKIVNWLRTKGLADALPEGGLLHLALDGRELASSSRLLDESIGNNSKLEIIVPPSNDIGGLSYKLSRQELW
eukprot:CAMPEP_0114349310 /NCGR_PEP_ID=MMETSP0101-20121206/15442_1 /TAXON_ID=38822 ORGANISM="Pteridomonas danica, Strain PT" /NCGR_SAMPLE_ID=MMETSP0101 /ASSEMBLY_ACC=CAM_ASM_000211 /LENGTH=447 /DNA_ID=CAMNT_0001487831 /DNA_START=13 /DNA_END=1353 /DNA_ORIENTATION=+